MGGFNPLQWGSDPTQLQPAPDPTQNQPADFSSSSTGSFPSGEAPATFTGGAPPAGTADLENQIGPAQQNLGNALQNQQAQGQPGQQPGQGQAPNFQDPLGPMIQDLVTRHQQLMQQTAPPSTGSPVKNMLRNFFTGAGNAMMVDAGLPSQNQQRLQLENQIGMLTSARSLYLDRQAEAASRQMQFADDEYTREPRVSLCHWNASASGHGHPARVFTSNFERKSRARSGPNCSPATPRSTRPKQDHTSANGDY
jgi:hypothetical protein